MNEGLNEGLLETGYAMMQVLAESSKPISAARVCKRLGVRMSSLQRCLAWFGSQQIGEVAGLGWVLAVQEEERLMLSLTSAGTAQWQTWQQEHAQQEAQEIVGEDGNENAPHPGN